MPLPVGGRPKASRRFIRILIFFAIVFFLGWLLSISCFAHGNANITCSWDADLNNGTAGQASGQFGFTCYATCPEDCDNDDGTDDNCSCTNCVAMSPQEMKQFKASSLDYIDLILNRVLECRSTITNVISKIRVELYEPLDEMVVSYYSGSLSDYVSMTNFVSDISSLVDDSNPVKVAYNSAKNKGNNDVLYDVGCWNGSLQYANDVKSKSVSYMTSLETANNRLLFVNTGLNDIRDEIEHLPDTPCKGSSCPPLDDGNGNGSAFQGDWCTVAQGDAIIDFLQDVSGYVESIDHYCKNIRDSVDRLFLSFINFAYTPYTAIPKTLYTGQFTNKNWKTYYLEAGDSGFQFGYSATNVLNRIELLLYGLAGVGEDDVDAPSSILDATADGNSISNAIDGVNGFFSGLASDFDSEGKQVMVDSFLNSLETFFDTFKFNVSPSADLDTSTSFSPAYTFSIGDASIDIPAITSSEEGVQIFNNFKLVVRSCFAVLWLTIAAISVFRYWAWVSSWVIKFSKWATELVSALFGK